MLRATIAAPILRALNRLRTEHDGKVFLDVNLRDPWWDGEAVWDWISMADWLKLNHNELQLLGLMCDDLATSAKAILQRFGLEGVIVTSGEEGAYLLTASGEQHTIKPEPVAEVVDTVGAGDAFTSVILAGLSAGWPLSQTMVRAQKLASAIVTIRGALPKNRDVYQNIIG